MTPSPTPPSQSSPRRRLLLPVMGALAVLAMTAGYLFWMRYQQPQPTPDDRPIATMMRDNEQPPLTLPDANVMQRILAGGDTSSLLATMPGDHPLLGEPADLSSIPGGVRLAAFRRQAAGVVEELAFWRVADQTLAQVDTFYDHAAKEQGYRPMTSENYQAGAADPPTHDVATTQPSANRHARPSNTQAVNRLYYPAPQSHARPDSTLVVRAWPDSNNKGIRILLWLRYPVR